MRAVLSKNPWYALPALVLAALLITIAPAWSSQVKPAATDQGEAGTEPRIWIDEQTGASLPLDAEFLDADGNQVRLGDLLDKPVILMPIYFHCPNSCPTNLANLAVALDRMKIEAGKDYRAIALSFNAQEGPEQATYAKRNYLMLLHQGFPADQWNFLTGDEQNISAVLDVIGYSFKPLEDGTFIHPSALVAVAQDGTVIKYVYGSFIPGDVELALLEADRGVPARSIKRLLNYCFNYDPDQNKSFFQITKLVALTLFGGLALFFFVKFIKRREPGADSDGNP